MTFLLLAASLFLTNPAPLDMPRAQAYLVSEGGVLRLEDQFNCFDLWTSQVVIGRWMDDDGRVFTLLTLDAAPPPVQTNATLTRLAFAAQRVPIEKRDKCLLRRALESLSPVPLPEDPRPPRQMPRGYRDVDYWQGTNTSALVCAFLPEKSSRWYLATWELLPEDVMADACERFEDEFLAKEWGAFLERHPIAAPHAKSEREALRADARHSVAAYDLWHVTDSTEFTVLDDLASSRTFVSSFTNELPRLRRRYAEVLPTPLDGSNVLCVARIFANRDEYIEAVDESMAWSAAYWSPLRRELVAYLPAAGLDELMRTIRHEAFHQYLSYATAMIPVSPWLNEGYAQYFEDETCTAFGLDFARTPDDFERLSKLIKPLLAMDYEAFYAGSDEERRLKYRLAWSLALFLEKGAPKVRFAPFEHLKHDYLDELINRSHDPLRATSAAFAKPETLDLFVDEWLKFWTKP